MSTARMQGHATIWVCTDCMMMLANGDGSGLSDDSPKPLSRIGDNEEITAGMMFEDHSEDCAYAHGDLSAECDCETRVFSASVCEGCGALAGERHAATIWWNGENNA